jgi:PPOX class probable F420-dependent enzyme
MDASERDDLLARSHRAVLATRRRDGRPQLSPVVYARDETGRLLISTRAATAKAHNARRDTAVSVCVLTDDFFGDWAQVDGQVSVIDMPEAAERLRWVYRQVAGEHPDWAEFDQDMVSQGRVVLVVTPFTAGAAGT